MVERALGEPRAWVLKPNLLGKTEGIVMGRHVDAVAVRRWRRRHRTMYCSRLSSSATFEIMSEVDGEVRLQAMHVVGLLPMLDGRSFGPGVYRAAPGDLVSVTGGGTARAGGGGGLTFRRR